VTPDIRTIEWIGNYRITASLGRGGMGEVYRAHDDRLGRDVAIKVLPAVFTSDGERLERFEREARVLASLNHPNVATIHGVERVATPSDAGSAAIHALVLELVDGETLDDRLRHVRDGAGLPLPEILSISRQIADALDAAHDKGIVHRDLKPANIKMNTQRVLAHLVRAFWRFLPEQARRSRVSALEATLRAGIDRSATQSQKAAWFNAYRDTMLSRRRRLARACVASGRKGTWAGVGRAG
jgi:hypothetical protein